MGRMTVAAEQENKDKVKEEKIQTAAVKEEESKQIDPKVAAFWTELTEEASNNYNDAFKNIIRSDEYTAPDGTVYNFKMLNHKAVGKLRKLQAEKVKEDEDFDKYVANYRERAKLLIQDMDDLKFDDGDFFILENLITAWSIRATKGFRSLIKK